MSHGKYSERQCDIQFLQMSANLLGDDVLSSQFEQMFPNWNSQRPPRSFQTELYQISPTATPVDTLRQKMGNFPRLIFHPFLNFLLTQLFQLPETTNSQGHQQKQWIFCTRWCLSNIFGNFLSFCCQHSWRLQDAIESHSLEGHQVAWPGDLVKGPTNHILLRSKWDLLATAFSLLFAQILF